MSNQRIWGWGSAAKIPVDQKTKTMRENVVVNSLLNIFLCVFGLVDLVL